MPQWLFFYQFTASRCETTKLYVVAHHHRSAGHLIEIVAMFFWNMVVGYVIVLFWCEKLLSLDFFQQRVPTLNFFYYIQILVAMTYKKAEVETLKSSIGGLRWFKCNPAHVINWSGWWFQTFSMFHFMYGMSSFPLTSSYFSRWLKPPTRWLVDIE